MGFFSINNEDGSLSHYSNIVTNAGITSLGGALASNTGPNWIYVATGLGSTAATATDTALEEEICRRPISGAHSPSIGVTRYLGVFTPSEGNGHWRELGIFDTPANRHYLSTCESTSGWSAGGHGTLVQETTVVQYLGASILCQTTASGTIPYETSTALQVLSNWSLGSVFQFWYRPSINLTGSLLVRLGSSNMNYYEWAFTPGDANQWSHFSRTFGEATVSGIPYSLQYFRLSHTAQGSIFNQYLDSLSVFNPGGTLMARGIVDAEKVYGTVRNVYYSTRIERG